MEFGIEKCAMFIMKSGKREVAEGMKNAVGGLETKKTKITLEYWKQISANKQR